MAPLQEGPQSEQDEQLRQAAHDTLGLIVDPPGLHQRIGQQRRKQQATEQIGEEDSGGAQQQCLGVTGPKEPAEMESKGELVEFRVPGL